ncbi:lysozyme inhibitor LprI family protein [Paraburkholderia sp. D15]|uniref:lysozyme inhibitor LprI family protein n=1 Tax=Paraburkholderia sp. D15 TaxID=2880218 RepID=UPI00247A0EFE|nr:lysozyme inhibitor LprI family protein [Paraburkholderia sp. D15]WGS49126.1 lysozyme inhibitor LprI family protein [Paraburkholderia sp. D15]
MTLTRCLAIALSCISTSSFAADCNNPPGGIDLVSAQGNLLCAENARISADKELNDTYKALLSNLEDKPENENFSRSQIVTAERAWVVFRDAECDFRTSSNGGADQWQVVNRSQCIGQLTGERAKTLRQYLEQSQTQ